MVRLWGKQCPYPLLVRVWTSVTTMDVSIKRFLTMPSSNCHATQQEQRIPYSPTETDSRMAVRVASLFTGIKEWNQPRHPSLSTTKWIVKMWCVQKIETYSAVKESPLRSLWGTWMILSILSCQVTQSRLRETKIIPSFSYVVLHFNVCRILIIYSIQVFSFTLINIFNFGICFVYVHFIYCVPLVLHWYFIVFYYSI